MVRRAGIWVAVVATVACIASSAGASPGEAVPASTPTSPEAAIVAAAPALTAPLAAPGAAGSDRVHAASSGQSVTAYFAQGLVDEPALDVWINDVLWATEVPPTGVLLGVIPAVDVVVDLRISGAGTSLPGFPRLVALAPYANEVITIAASYGTGGSPEPGLTLATLWTNFSQNVQTLSVGGLQYLHAANVGAVSAAAGGSSFAPPIEHGQVLYAGVATGFHEVGFVESGVGPLASMELPAVPGWQTVAVLVGDATGTQFDVAWFPIRVGAGYTLIANDGGVFTFGEAFFFGGLGGLPLNAPVVTGASAPGGLGYWLVAADGGVFTFGEAQFFGSTGGMTLNSPVISMIPTPTGAGYWLLAADGGVFTFGDAEFFGSTGNLTLNAPVITGAATPSGRGYWLVAADGGIFSFGDAEFYGSTGDLTLNRPVIGMAAAPGGLGYFLVAADGGVFTFGLAQFYGSAVGSVQGSVVALATTPTQRGYWVTTDTGEVRAFGDAPFFGDLAQASLNGRIISIFA